MTDWQFWVALSPFAILLLLIFVLAVSGVMPGPCYRVPQLPFPGISFRDDSLKAMHSAREAAERASKQAILHQAISAVIARGRNYGDVEDNFERIARRWRAHIKNRFGMDVPVDAVSVALMMDDVKSARLENDPTHEDSWVDKAGYAACGGEVAGRMTK